MAQDFESVEEYKAHKLRKHQEMLMKQRVPYSIKVKMSEDRIRSFIEECDRRGLNYHVSVGGLDSIVLAKLIERMGYDVPRVSASSLEDKSIQEVHKEMGCIVVNPLKSKIKILQDEGFPRALGMAGFGIDTSVASLEEVQNAMANQTEEKGEPKADRKASPKQIEFLLSRYEGENLEKLLKANNITKIEDLSMATASNLISKLKGAKA